MLTTGGGGATAPTDIEVGDAAHITWCRQQPPPPQIRELLAQNLRGARIEKLSQAAASRTRHVLSSPVLPAVARRTAGPLQ